MPPTSLTAVDEAMEQARIAERERRRAGQRARQRLVEMSNELASPNPRCPFCHQRTYAKRVSQGDYPVIECSNCRVRIELRVLQDLDNHDNGESE